MNDHDRLRLEYFQKHALPWQIEHMKMRSIGLQVFIPTQGVFLGAWGYSKLSLIPWLAIASCLCWFLWDQRIRFVIGRVHEWGRELADRQLFPLDQQGRPTDGVHVAFGDALERSGRLTPPPSAWQSHTVAIRLLLLTACILWVLVLFGLGR